MRLAGAATESRLRIAALPIVARLDAARAVGLVAVILFVEADNARARALYLSFGFRRYGTDPRVAVIDGVYYDADLMILDLDS